MRVETAPRFRLLDGYVGWEPLSGPASPYDPDGTTNVITNDEYGLRLQNLETPEIADDVLSPYMPPAWLAQGCQPFEWYLCPATVDSQRRSRLLRRDSCSEAWQDLFPELPESGDLRGPVAVHAWKRFLAVVDGPGDGQPGRLMIWSKPDRRVTGSISLAADEHPLAIGHAWGEFIVSVVRHRNGADERRLLRFDQACVPRGEIAIPVATSQLGRPLCRLATAKDGSLWIAEGNPGETFLLWKVTLTLRDPATEQVCCAPQEFVVHKVTEMEIARSANEQLSAIFSQTGLIAVRDDRFCLKGPMIAGIGNSSCFDRNGNTQVISSKRVSSGCQGGDGMLVTKPLDSFIPRCRWHRIRLDVDVPRDTNFTIMVATSESGEYPHLLDWQTSPENSTDLLIQQPPGRYLFAKIKLTSTQATSPVIRRVRIDFPRRTSLEQLPAVFREDPEAEDFTERFLSLFDATIEDLDRAIERFPALLDVAGVPDDVLPWLGMFLGIAFDPAWDAERRRGLLQAAPYLYRQRGTMAGLIAAIELIFGVRPLIKEHVNERAWGTIGQRHSVGEAVGTDARLGTVRLFGSSRTRFRLGKSPLNMAPLRSFGNPDHDPVRAVAHRFSVMVPDSPNLSKLGVAQLDRLITHQKPAHTLHSLRVGNQGFVLGVTSVVGIDTTLRVTPPPVLGRSDSNLCSAGNVRLSRTSILRSGPHGPHVGLGVGSAKIGINTVLE